MKTLAMIKMEKNFIAVMTKRYPRKPYEHFTIDFLLSRLKEEVMELELAVKARVYDKATLECGDVSNLTDYIFEQIIQQKEEKKQSDMKTITSLSSLFDHEIFNPTEDEKNEEMS